VRDVFELKMVESDNKLRVYDSIADLIAHPESLTPMVRLNERINKNLDFPIYLKLERYNPFGSIKDRIALSMLEGAEIKDGKRYVNPNQYENDLNIEARYKNTGPEIWKQTEGRIEYFFAGFGTCGTIMGVGRFLKEQNPSVKVVGIEPTNVCHNLPGMKRISDLKENLVPKILDKSVIDDIVAVEDDEAYRTGVELARKTGILVGPTTGAILNVALKYAENSKGMAVVISPDDAFKYVSLYAPYVKDDSKPKIWSEKR